MSSIMDSYHLQSDSARLQTYVHEIQTTSDPLIFFITIDDSIKLLKNVKNYVHQRHNNKANKLPKSVIVQVFDFLSHRFRFRVGYLICKNWHTALHPSSVAKYRRRTYTGAEYLHSWMLDLKPQGMALVPNSSKLIVVNEEKDELYLWDTIQNVVVDRIRVNDRAYQVGTNQKYICTYSRDSPICQYSLDYKLIRKWRLEKQPMGMALDDDFVYVSTSNTIESYALEDGKFIREWNIKPGISNMSKKLATYKDEIFMVDCEKCIIIVYSKLGMELRRWGRKGTASGQFGNPWGIAICDDIVYITEWSNCRIQAFDRNGSYLFQCSPPKTVDTRLPTICALDNSLYVNDWRQYIHRFELL